MSDSTAKKKSARFSFGMFLVTIGIVYGDIGTSPLYVLKSILEGNGGIGEVNEEFIVGALSLIIWTVTLLTTVKYVLIAMKADNHGEGGIFSLYHLVKNCGKWLIVPAIIGGAMLLADGIITPAVTVTTAIEGLRSIEVMHQFLGDKQAKVLIITLTIISVLFLVQRAGTSKIGRAFGPVMLVWFSFLGVMGLINIPKAAVVLKAFNPIHAVQLLASPANKAGFMILGSVFLATTGAEALYSDMGHVGRNNVYFSWPFVKICLLTNYLGQGAWIISNLENMELRTIHDMNPFFQMLVPGLRPVAVLLSAGAAIIASQALITGSYTLVSEAIHLDLMPHLEINYPSDTMGQLYIPLVNRILWIGCTAVVLYFKTGARMEAAYGLAITMTMLMTTLLLTVYLWYVRMKKVLACAILVVFGVIESVFFVSSCGKFTKGGYISVVIATLLIIVMLIWYRGTQLERRFSNRLKVKDYASNLKALRENTSIPATADNVVFLENGSDLETVDRNTLYSILDKDLKRARAWWFISVHVMDVPSVMNYEVETYGTDFAFRVKLNLGFKDEQCVNVYLRQIVHDLLESGEMPPQERLYSIYGPSDVGSFKFCLLKTSVPSKSGLKQLDELVLRAKYGIRRLAGSKAKWYGLDTSMQIVESVPLFVAGSRPDLKLTRK